MTAHGDALPIYSASPCDEGRCIYPFIIFCHHILQYALLQVLEALLIILVLGPEHCANLWHASLEGVRDYWFFLLVRFMCLSTLLALYVPVLVWSLMFYEGVGLWPACVSSPISSNIDPGRLLLGVLLHPPPLIGDSSMLWGVSCSFFFSIRRGSDRGTCLEFSSGRGSDRGTCLNFFLSTVYLLILFS